MRTAHQLQRYSPDFSGYINLLPGQPDPTFHDFSALYTQHFCE